MGDLNHVGIQHKLWRLMNPEAQTMAEILHRSGVKILNVVVVNQTQFILEINGRRQRMVLERA
jgi:hypothetical protein